ncbi:MAG: fatty acid amide hydrolase 2, partial [Myxococcota bacterium]
NVPEGGLWMEADSKVYGRTNNPWNHKRSPGGSSGGEGAIVAAGGSPLGLGADIGGSIRIPAAFCGLVGHKPSGRLVPTTGHFPSPEETLLPALCLGPMVRRVEDLWPALTVLAGPDGRCPVAREFSLGHPDQVRMDELVVYRLDAGSRPRLRKPMREALDKSFAALEERGAKIDTIEVPELRHGVEMWAAFLEEGTTGGYAELLSPDRPMNPWWELLKLPFGQSRHTLPALLMVAAEGLTKLAPGRTKQMLERFATLKERLHTRLGDNGVFLFAPYTRPAPRHRMALVTPYDAACTCTFNPLEFPGTVLPVGFADDGLPVSVQIGALPGNDRLTIAVAGELEKAFGGWTCAPPALKASPTA